MDIFYYADFYALGLLGVLVTVFVIRSWRSGGRGWSLIMGSWAYFFGTFVTVTMAFHNAEILWRIIPKTPISHGTKPEYDFRFYGLILFGTVMIIQGTAIMKAARALILKEENARKLIIRHTLLVLALCMPLIPLHIFAGLTTILSLLNLAAVGLVGQNIKDALKINQFNKGEIYYEK